jgi:hypothetical protein
MFKVGKPELLQRSWKAEDIASKCIIIPDSPEFNNPLPDLVRYASSHDERVKRHGMIFRYFPEKQTWTVISLLLPGREY